MKVFISYSRQDEAAVRSLEQTKEFAKANKWLLHTVIRHYKWHARASAEGLVVTEYLANRVALQAREDFYKLALELSTWAAGRMMARGQRTSPATRSIARLPTQTEWRHGLH